MAHGDGAERVPDWLLERFALGELPPERLDAVRARLEAEPGGLERLDALRASNAEILRTLPPRVAAAGIRERLDRARAPAGRRLWALIPAAAALIALVSIVPPEQSATGPDERVEAPEVTRKKGLGPQLWIHRQGDGGATRLRDGAAAAEADLLQISYVAGPAEWGLIFSVDGGGVVTMHTDGAAPLEPEGRVALARSYELDDAPDFERFFFVSGEQPFEAEPVIDAALATGAGEALALEEDLYQVSITLWKGAP